MVYWFWTTLSVERGTVLKEKDNYPHKNQRYNQKIKGGGGTCSLGGGWPLVRELTLHRETVWIKLRRN